MTQIITLTANPAIDISTSVGKIAPFSKLRCAPAHHDPGGGGINVARVVKRLGGDAVAIYPAGGSSGQLLEALMKREGVRSIATPAALETRENLTVFEEATQQQYRFVMPGAPLADREWAECLSSLERAEPPRFVVASGSLPPGVPEDFFARAAGIAARLGARMVVDTSGAALKCALNAGLYLIKPNLREFRALAGIRSTDEPVLIEAGRRLIDQGLVQCVALTLGRDGALLIGADWAFRAAGLPIRPASVVGAGDSFLGAMIWSLANGDRLDAALRYGVAAGSAALLNPGTELCRHEDVARLVPQVTVRAVVPPAGAG